MWYIVIMIVIVGLLLESVFEPRLENNYQTGEKLLFYNDFSSKFVTRKYIKIW